MVTTADTVVDRAPDAEEGTPPAPSGGWRTGLRIPVLIEAAAVLLSPVALFYILRVRAMAPLDEPDPSMHTTFIVDPRDIFARYTALFTPTSRLREAARVGFLVPARIDYLLFGAVPGFFVTRYAFALIAIVPVYLLLRRLYGPAAGAVGIAVIMTCPVILNAWGTDYPDSAVVSYVAGALACLAMPSSERGRRWWLAAAAFLLTMAIWAHGIGVVIALPTLVCYLVIRLVRARGGLLADIGLFAGVAVGTTALLSVGSELLLGHFDFILPTWQAFRYLSTPAQEAIWHSAAWGWAPYVAYILVPPAVAGAFLVVFGRRIRNLPTPHLIVGAAFISQVLVFWFMQFYGNLQTLEMHLFSSTLWASTCIAVALLISEACKSLFAHPVARWLPALAVLVVALVYELGYAIHPHAARFGWLPYGFLVAGLLIVFAGIARLAGRSRERPVQWGGALFGIMGLLACALVLTVTTVPPHAHIANTSADPNPAYATALGGNGSALVDNYRVTAELPFWVGHPSYPGEILLTWWPVPEGPQLNGPVGIYHSGFNSLLSTPPALSPYDRLVIQQRRAGEILLFGYSAAGFAGGVNTLARYGYDPLVTKRGVLSSGPVHLHVWLVELRKYAHA